MSTSNTLISEHICPNLRGYYYIMRAVELYEFDKPMMDIYKTIAAEYHRDYCVVERGIRHAKERSNRFRTYTNEEVISILKMEVMECQNSRENESVGSEEVTLEDTKKTTQESTQV